MVDGRHVAQLTYDRARGLPVALCAAGLGGGGALEVKRHGAQRAASWQDGTYTYVVVGELRDIAGRAARQVGAGRG